MSADQPLTDPRDIRKLLDKVRYRGDRIDGKLEKSRYSMASSLVRHVLDAAQYQGLSGEDAMTLLAYHALRGYEKTMDMVLLDEMTRPIPPLIFKLSEESKL